MDSAERHTFDLMLQAAAQGVSADNGQPWRFRWRRSRLSLLVDRPRARSFFDQGGYAAMFGVGSVLENLTIAARHLGYEPAVRLFPSGPDREQVADVTFHPIHHKAHQTRHEVQPARQDDEDLYEMIHARTTNRKPYWSMSVASETLASLSAVAASWSGFRLSFLQLPDLRASLSALTVRADRVRFDFSSQAVHADFFDCLRYTHNQARSTGDGLWVDCLELGRGGTLGLRALSRWRWARAAGQLGLNRLFAAQSRHLLQRTPLIVSAIGTASIDEEVHHALSRMFMEGGRLGQRLWLTATALGMACQPMAVLPLFFAQLVRDGPSGFPAGQGEIIRRVREDCGALFNLSAGEHLVMVFRMGYAPPPSARAFRRPLGDLLTIEDDSPLAAASDTTA